MDPNKYAEHWSKESALFEKQGVYQWLSAITPTGNILEIGSGTGSGTIALAATRKVLTIDNNPDLVEIARSRIKSSGVQAEILVADFLAPSADVIECITGFTSEVIVGWFLGSNADDQETYVAAEVPENERAKKYREHVEDALMTMPLCQPSVEWIHLAIRASRVIEFSEEESRQSQIDDYNEFVFKPNGFEAHDVQFFHWDRQGSSFQYGSAPNPNLASGERTPMIVSVLAKRTRPI